MPTNIDNWVRDANPVELLTIAQRLARCVGSCPAGCHDNQEDCNNERPIKCANAFKRWALSQSKGDGGKCL